MTEEITRLRSHLDQFADLKNLNDETGKRMDFILQEMNREVTTVLSKTSGLNERGAAIGTGGHRNQGRNRKIEGASPEY